MTEEETANFVALQLVLKALIVSLERNPHTAKSVQLAKRIALKKVAGVASSGLTDPAAPSMTFSDQVYESVEELFRILPASGEK